MMKPWKQPIATPCMAMALGYNFGCGTEVKSLPVPGCVICVQQCNEFTQLNRAYWVNYSAVRRPLHWYSGQVYSLTVMPWCRMI